MPEIYRVDQPNIMHEMIDDEVVVVNLDSGIYYSFDGVGGRLWQLLDGGRSLKSVTALAATLYQGDPDHIASEVGRFLNQLREEQLVNIVVAEESGGGVTGDTFDSGGIRPVFTAPVLNKYTDMEALLLADPIHEVDEDAGWPNVKQ
ncbi:MAG: PqqD family protein [Candidatus Competibacteraceae bacterium]